ncbi:HipA family kinase [Phaeobacter marinintestinus]|uniref:HipA family kinase n=1 Tax=Falsiphaeobacter marinintestinus TaxID=1492905 RepID=UPI0011B7FF28|nr:HipA family kinase [Phaeobacter marinintestinus]
MVLTVEASEYLDRAATGRSRPMLCVCDERDGEARYVYVKYENFHEELTSDHLVAELVANVFARDLGLPAAEPCLVQIDAAFVGTLPDTADGVALCAALQGAPVTAFGSTQISPVRRWAPTDLVHKSQRQEAALLYLFDTLIENTDRGNGNPNLLMSGLSFKVIDFGHSFQRCHRRATLNGSTMPWCNGGIGNHFPGNMQHIMYPSCREVDTEVLEDFTSSLEALTDAKIEGYVEVIPQQWDQDTACAIIEYLLQARENANQFIEQVRGVLK